MARILDTILPESVHNEGLLFVPQILEDMMRGKLDAEFPPKLDEGDDPASVRAFVFDRAKRLYAGFAESSAQTNVEAVTRKFVVNLLDNAFGWDFDKSAATGKNAAFLLPPVLDGGDGTSTPLAFPVILAPHTLGLDESNPRFHGWGLSDASRSATRFAQEFLNERDDFLWAIVTNGRELRLVRDNPSLTRPSFLSFDLTAMLSGTGDFPAFAFLWRMLHVSRAEGISAENSVWEKLHARSTETGVRALDGLRPGVAAAIEILGTGFIRENPSIREAFTTGTLDVAGYEQELLRLAYRFLFLFVAEERDLLHTPDTPPAVRKVYRQGYSMLRLKRLAARYAAGSSDRHHDLYIGLKYVFRALAHGEPRLGLTALGGIFGEEECPHLKDALITNADLLAAIRKLRFIDAGRHLYPVNYRDIGSEEIGSLYEGILELVPNYNAGSRQLTLVGAAGNNRKTTGSYYTPSSLVDKQIESALDPLLDRAMKAADPAKAILDLNVIDTSCGSGHFVVAAARRMASRLVAARGVDTSPTEYQRALRDVVRNSIYGVDINPLAVELAKITLWIESVVPGEPLTFLDSHFICGDATLGIDNLKNLEHGIPNAAYKPLTGDDKDAAKELSKRNRAALKSMEDDARYGGDLFYDSKHTLANQMSVIDEMPEDTLAEIEAKKAAYAKFREEGCLNHFNLAADVFTAAFLLPKTSVDVEIGTLGNGTPLTERKPDPTIPTTAELYGIITAGAAGSYPSAESLDRCAKICRKNRVLHWPLAFPVVFERGGFDCILTNPPWDRIKLQEKEFFAARDPEIANAQNAAARKRLIESLPKNNPTLYQVFQDAKRNADVSSAFIHESGRYRLANVGDTNLYAVISEVILNIVNITGRAGFIVPISLCTDEPNKALFGEMISSRKLVSFYGFENEEKLFHDVHHAFKFALLTLGQAEATDFSFFNRQVQALVDGKRHFCLLPSDFALINPKTKTAPIFRTKFDADLSKKIYSHVGVLNSGEACGNPWSIEYGTLFHMANDSAIFYDHGAENLLPLYEAKLFWLYDHRFASYEGDGEVRYVSTEEKGRVDYAITPRYWVSNEHLQEALSHGSLGYLLAWRKITSSTNERTTVATVLPEFPAGDSVHLFWVKQDNKLKACLLADVCSLVHDWCARQKVGGSNFSFYLFDQVATLSPSAYSQDDIDFIVPRVLELTYTSHSLKGWAEALGYKGEPFVFDPERRAILRAELDARYAKLYGLNEQELRYILDPADVYGEDYPSESFRVLKEKELAEFGEYRTRRMVLDVWHAQETPSVVADGYKRTQTWDDSRPSYLRFLVGQMIAQSSTHQMPLIEIFSAFSALRTPKEMARMDGMPQGAAKWAREYTDAIRDGESLEGVLMRMFEAGEISISKSGIVSYVDEGSLHAADGLLDVVTDARMALAFMRLDLTQARVEHIRAVISPEFFRKVMEGAYARAA